MFVGVIRLIRRIMYIEPLDVSPKQKQDDRISLIGLGADFIAGVSTLPHEFLWAGRLSKRTTATLSLIASVVGLYKCF